MQKIRISAVSYLNTYPFLYGIYSDKKLSERIEISTDYPSLCAKKLLNNEVDVGLVPVGILPKIDNYEIITDYCIAANGIVKSVILFSQTKIENIENIILDYQSVTSVNLLKILIKKYWNLRPIYIKSINGYEQNIKGNTAGLIIGDRALNLLDKFTYKYDLAEIWQKMTGLPFVFATWTANKHLDDEFLHQFQSALKFGVENIDESLEYFAEKTKKINFNAKKYLTENIRYLYGDKEKQSVSLFLEFMQEMNLPQELILPK